MKRLLFSSWMSAVLLPFMGLATDAYYINNGYVYSAPVIDATNFVNNGTFDIFTYPLPFETSNTRNFTNNGTMTGGVGWRFDTAPAGTGVRKMAANFFNGNGATISALDIFYYYYSGMTTPNGAITPSYLLVSATNIVNQGLLIASANGTIELTGNNINLSRSGVEIMPITGLSGGGLNFTTTNWFTPDEGIADNYWAQTNMNIDSTVIWVTNRFTRSSKAQTPSHSVQIAGAIGPTNIQFALTNPVADSYFRIVDGVTIKVTNGFDPSTLQILTEDIFVPTNIIGQAVFVGSANRNVSVQTRFHASSSSTNPLQTISVKLAMVSTNLVTGAAEQDAVYLVDTLASETNLNLLLNSLTFSTYRPANYLVLRSAPDVFLSGFTGDGVPTNGFFYSPDFTNTVVNGPYAAYSASIDNVVSEQPAVVGSSVTNLPGRIRINANSLDLTRTRLRGEGEIMIQASHIVGSSNAVVDCPNLSYNVGATNGNLNILNLAKPSVARLRGNIYAWSGLWTNAAFVAHDSYLVNTNTGISIYAPRTNIARYVFHVLILDGRALETQMPVTVYDMITHSTNIVISDNMTVAQSFLVDGLSFTLNGSVTLANGLQNWTAATAPKLLYFTNNGSLYIPNEAHFGDDTPTPYAAFVNNGVIYDYYGGQTINSSNVLITGYNVSGNNYLSAALTLIANTCQVVGGQLYSGGDTVFNTDTLQLSNYAVNSAGGTVYFNVTKSLSDDNGGSVNLIQCQNGFQLSSKPQTGDLLETTFDTLAPVYESVAHVWAGVDRGPTAAGFSDNAAIGRLVLEAGGNGSWDQEPEFVFSGAGVSNALYVDYLDLSYLTNYDFLDGFLVTIDPNLVIYYADSTVGGDLDGKFGGHLRWVPSFAGPSSSVDVVINGKTVKVNRALRYSKTIDSDGDGIANYYDSTPFGSLTAFLVNSNGSSPKVATSQSAKTLGLSWPAFPDTIYQVEFTTNLPAVNWQLLLKYTNNVSTNRFVTIYDTNTPADATRRFYRLNYTQ